MDESEGPPESVPTEMGAAAAQRALERPLSGTVRGWNEHLSRIAEGDQEALKRLYDESSSLVYSLARRILSDEADAEEVTVDVFAQVWRTARTFEARRGSAASWLGTLARSRAIDRLRAHGTRRKKETPLNSAQSLRAAANLPDEESILAQERGLVRKALALLSPEQREAIELAYFGGLSHAELAARLRAPLGTVKTRIRLAMMKLRESLQPLLLERAQG